MTTNTPTPTVPLSTLHPGDRAQIPSLFRGRTFLIVDPQNWALTPRGGATPYEVHTPPPYVVVDLTSGNLFGLFEDKRVLPGVHEALAHLAPLQAGGEVADTLCVPKETPREREQALECAYQNGWRDRANANTDAPPQTLTLVIPAGSTVEVRPGAIVEGRR